MSIVQSVLLVGIFLFAAVPSIDVVTAFASPKLTRTFGGTTPTSPFEAAPLSSLLDPSSISPSVSTPTKRSTSARCSSLSASDEAAQDDKNEPVSTAKAIRVGIRRATGLSFTAMRKTLRGITGFSWTALRGTLRAATGISLTAIWLSTTAATGLWIRKTTSVVLSIFPAWLRFFIQPLLVLYYTPLMFLRSMTSGPVRNRETYWTRVQRAAEKAEQDGYWPVRVGEDGLYEPVAPPEPEDSVDGRNSNNRNDSKKN